MAKKLPPSDKPPPGKEGRKEITRRLKNRPDGHPADAGPPGDRSAYAKKAWSKKGKQRDPETVVGNVTHMLLQKDSDILTRLDTEGREARMVAFFEGFIELGTVAAGCRNAGISRFQYYRWLEKYPEFKEQMEAAFEIVADDLEEEALTRAKAKSDLLLIFTLKKFKPQYRDNYKPEPPKKGGAGGEVPAARRRIEEKLKSIGGKKLPTSPKQEIVVEKVEDDEE